MPRTLTQQELAQYDEHGYVVIRDAIPADILRRSIAETERMVAVASTLTEAIPMLDLDPSHTPEKPRVRRIKSPHEHSEYFKALAADPALQAFVDVRIPLKRWGRPEEIAPAAVFLTDGKLQRPRGYRSWIHVGTPLTPNDMNNGKAAFPEFDTVYIDPESHRHYQQTGEWRDGTVMVKELTDVGGKAAASGNGYFQGGFLGVAASIKSRARFPTEPGNWERPRTPETISLRVSCPRA